MSNRAKFPQLTDRDWLAREYGEKGRSCTDIADEVGCSAGNVDLRLRQFDIPRRPKSHRTSFREKICERCGNGYIPNGPAQRLCDDCWLIKTCQGCGHEFKVDAAERRKHRPVAVLCEVCRASARGAPAAERWSAGRQHMADTGEFTCRDCQGQFPESEAVKDSSRASGHTERCTGCAGARGAAYRSDEAYMVIQRKRQRECSYRKFGASVADYDRLYAEQDGRCAVCGHKPELDEGILQFDHDHAGVRHRGLLCRHCNSALGLMMDDPARLRTAADYLELWQELRSVSFS